MSKTKHMSLKNFTRDTLCLSFSQEDLSLQKSEALYIYTNSWCSSI